MLKIGKHANSNDDIPEGAGSGRYRGLVYWISISFGAIGIYLSVNQIFSLGTFGGPLLDASFLYAELALFMSVSFLIFPAHAAHKSYVPAYDWVLFALCFLVNLYMSMNGERIIEQGWDMSAPTIPTLFSAALCFLSIEAVRRTGGTSVAIIVGIFFTFPLWTSHAPGFLWGVGKTPAQLVNAFAMGSDSIVGVPTRAVGSILMGFLVFGSTLVITGGGQFFMSLANSLLGSSRGGPAKVAIISSGFFGSLSGSAVSNVVTTGKLTIPTMKRIGYSPTYAGAIEACASTGGVLMPPIMGAVAFLMAEFLNIPYSQVLIAAIVPALVFYLSLILQVDCYAAANDLPGLNAEEVPSIMETLRGGWHYLLALAALVYMLVWARLEVQAPYYATVILIVLTAIVKGSRFNFRMLVDILGDATQSIANMFSICAGIGLIVGAMAFTGVGGAFSRELLYIAGENVPLLLVMGAFTSFLLGMGMTASACYIFLAIALGPALVGAGLNPIASHMFILYWGVLSYITPPVALAAVAAAPIAGADTMKVGVQAMRLGLINFILPFAFALNPQLVLQGTWMEIAPAILSTVLAVWLFASAAEGYVYRIGKIGRFSRLTIFGAACLFLFQNILLAMLGAFLVAVSFGICFRKAGFRLRTSRIQ